MILTFTHRDFVKRREEVWKCSLFARGSNIVVRVTDLTVCILPPRKRKWVPVRNITRWYTREFQEYVRPPPELKDLMIEAVCRNIGFEEDQLDLVTEIDLDKSYLHDAYFDPKIALIDLPKT